ncbi:unnamed protein product [Discula destructiva]
MSASSTALALSKQRTPIRSTPANNTPVTESPGNWQHPRIDEITRRQNATVFASDNVKTILYNFAALFILALIQRVNADFGPKALHGAEAKLYVSWAFYACYMLPFWNIGMACLPLLRKKDDMSDIPLTAAQRQLLGLPQSSKPEAPNTVYSTPPRYARTPSIAGSTGKVSPSGSPLSASGGSLTASVLNGSPYTPVASPLLHKSVGYSGRRSFSQGSGSPFSASTANILGASFNSSVFSEPPATPSPPGGKRISVGLNNKWLYERSRRSSTNVWP